MKNDELDINRYAYALIDRAAIYDVPENLPHIHLHPCADCDPHTLYPCLLPLHELDGETKQALWEEVQYDVSCHRPPLFSVLFNASFSSAEVAAYLSQKLLFRQKTPPHRHFLLRYYDPRVLFQLAWMCSPITFKSFCGRNGWTVLLNDKWHSLRSSAQAGPGTVSLDQLRRIGFINRVLDVLPVCNDLIIRETVSRAINQLIMRAQSEHGLTEEDDVVAFATHGMTIHPVFDRHPTIVNLLRLHTLRSTRYVETSALLNDAQWQKITSECHVNLPKGASHVR